MLFFLPTSASGGTSAPTGQWIVEFEFAGHRTRQPPTRRALYMPFTLAMDPTLTLAGMARYYRPGDGRRPPPIPPPAPPLRPSQLRGTPARVIRNAAATLQFSLSMSG